MRDIRYNFFRVYTGGDIIFEKEHLRLYYGVSHWRGGGGVGWDENSEFGP